MMTCCMCQEQAIVTFGLTKDGAKRFAVGYRTYYAYGRRSVLLAFCDRHLEEAATTWPGLALNPVQPVHRARARGRLAIERVKRRLEDPAVQRRIATPERDRAIARAVGELRRQPGPRSLNQIMVEAAGRIGIDLKPSHDLTRAQLGSLLAFIRTMSSR